MAPRKRLSTQDWVEAAVSALREGGPPAVAVEPLAARLGATKGSFYWHFAHRSALLEAALLHWERTATDLVIERVDGGPGGGPDGGTDPRDRLRTLLEVTFTHAGGPHRPVEVGLLPHAGDPAVAPTLERVTRRRLEYLAALFGDLGLPAAEARHRATLAYSAYLGHAQLVHATPGALPGVGPGRAYLDSVSATLLAPPGSPA